MSDSSPETIQMFDEFNESRKALSSQFYGLIDLVANHVFSGNVSIQDRKNLLNQINNQKDLVEAEKNLLRNLYYYANNLQESQFLLGVFGRFKAGKSTLLNTLAGEYISPMNTRISTGVLNFTYSSDVEECTVHYDNGQKETIDPALKDEYIDFRHNPDNEKGIHSVRHGCPNLALQKEIVFVDTPGLEAVNSIHEKITLDFVMQCHVAVVVSTYPPFGEGELRFYKRIHKSIPNTFLVQNLPKDKLESWIPLEAQTLENLHKLGFYEINKDIYGEEDHCEILRKIGDDKDEEQLNKFKNAHDIHLYSLCALAAHDVLNSKNSELSTEDKNKLADSRFMLFKKDLYHFLTNHRGQNMLADYLVKGQLILNGLIKMVKDKQSLLQQSLEEIERNIAKEEKQQQKTMQLTEMIADRASLKILELYRELKSRVMKDDINQALGEVKEKYAEKNIYRLNKRELKDIKTQVSAFNRLFGQRYQKFVDELGKITETAQSEIGEQLQNRATFKNIVLDTNAGAVGVGEISGAGYLDRTFDFIFHGGITYVAASMCGGSGWQILVPFLKPAVGVNSASLVALTVGGIIGLALSIPLAKRFAPFLDKCKTFIGKFYSKPTKVVFDEFEANTRKKLDEVEITAVDNLKNSFKEQANASITQFFEMVNKTLKELRQQKENGNEMQENEKLCSILEQLEKIQTQFSNMEQKDVSQQKVQKVLTGLKGLIGKFKK
ncbi:dynamin family protein [Candidatus Uabimicrobium sp. HlEnr_7]|uniref:dynamin family protein n=1 Tax=Candidatus Uabimicrobium helgolandensis TaxID=3095367 RepID=UPI0035585C95